MTAIKGITIVKLTELCRKYDEEYGWYPESEYEGKAVLKFICGELEKMRKEMEE